MVAFSLILMSWFAAEPDPWRLARLPFVRTDASRPPPPHAEPEPEPRRQFLRAAAARAWAAVDGVATDRRPDTALDRWAASLAGLRPELAASQIEPVFNACAHLACNRLGTDWDGERRLRHLAARAVTEVAA
jgi:hypothetical protein